MKAIVHVDSNECLYLVSDKTPILPLEDRIIVGSGKDSFVIGDRNVTTAIIYENVDAPNDWMPSKYLFDGNNWEDNPIWVMPVPKISDPNKFE
jgi:hypothetical protein